VSRWSDDPHKSRNNEGGGRRRKDEEEEELCDSGGKPRRIKEVNVRYKLWCWKLQNGWNLRYLPR
jgi:hypothetical protein